MKFPQPKLRKARIEIVPMIDTIFFLLVFFMFTTLSMVKMQGLGLNVPTDSAAAGAPGKTPARMTLSVAPDGRYYLNARPIAPADMPTALQQELARRPGAAVVVNVAPTQSTQTLISVMDIVNETMTRAGSSAPIVIATERVKTDAGDTGQDPGHVDR
ncbi:biopolymer transporter ExbD [Capsulimonas corticalis]|uniref:Biopolymer transporter ExbD n=1 Tax=Capsulimonas corticalis TaxID=2219043 RepID=A0A402D215_9BACT|nr:biopolymer transporter ExbD [Capsulimonas corticalis]BDI30115.1 biopolymer transporter ExbD [Capsulimonas corticalis]